jgi:hypothetical protein
MTKQVVYNDYGKQYKEIFLYYDNYKNLNEEQTVYSLTGKKSTIIYDYDGNGRVIKKSENADLFDKINNEWIYKYDITGNLTEEKFYKNGKAISTTEYLYDSKTMLLTARLTKDENTGTITIIKYTTVWRE